MILRLILKAVLIALVLPALGLIVFNGGIGGALLTAIAVGVAYFFTNLVLLPALVSVGLLGVAAGGLIGGSLGASAVVFAIRTGMYGIALWAAASLFSSVVLLGFWPTMGAGALLAIVSLIGRD